MRVAKLNRLPLSWNLAKTPESKALSSTKPHTPLLHSCPETSFTECWSEYSPTLLPSSLQKQKGCSEPEKLPGREGKSVPSPCSGPVRARRVLQIQRCCTGRFCKEPPQVPSYWSTWGQAQAARLELLKDIRLPRGGEGQKAASRWGDSPLNTALLYAQSP